MPDGFKELSLGANSSSVISLRPNVERLNLGPETPNAEEAGNLESASALIEVNPNERLSVVLYQFRESRLSGISFSYSSNGQEILQPIFKEHGSIDGVEASAESNFAMIKWIVDNSIVYLSLPIDWPEGQNSQASYQIMSEEEAKDFVFFRAKELAKREANGDQLEGFAARVRGFQERLLNEALEMPLTETIGGSGQNLKFVEKVTAPESVIEEEPAGEVVTEPNEEDAEQSSKWLLWLIGALVFVGGLGLVLRRKS